MKSAYVVCALLCVTIGSLVLANDDAKGSSNRTQLSAENNATTAVPRDKSENAATVGTSSTTTTATTATTATASTTPSTKSTTANTTHITNAPTTPIPSTTTNASITTTTKPTTTTPNPTSTTTTASSSTTTAIPAPSPSKDRHFDGLSFFGGIILATCLMAIAVFAWKFYRQCNEGNYRTL